MGKEVVIGLFILFLILLVGVVSAPGNETEDPVPINCTNDSDCPEGKVCKENFCILEEDEEENETTIDKVCCSRIMKENKTGNQGKSWYTFISRTSCVDSDAYIVEIVDDSFCEKDKEMICCKVIKYKEEIDEKIVQYVETKNGLCVSDGVYEKYIVDEEFCDKKLGEEIKARIREKQRIHFEEKTGVTCPEECVCTGSTIKCILASGREMTVIAGESGNTIVKFQSNEMSTKVELYKSGEGKVYGKFEDGEKEIKVFPEEIKAKVKKKIGEKKKTEEVDDIEIELDEEGKYRYEVNKHAKLFGIIGVKERIRAMIDSETGEVGELKGPWWGFLASDIEEE